MCGRTPKQSGVSISIEKSIHTYRGQKQFTLAKTQEDINPPCTEIIHLTSDKRSTGLVQCCQFNITGDRNANLLCRSFIIRHDANDVLIILPPNLTYQLGAEGHLNLMKVFGRRVFCLVC